MRWPSAALSGPQRPLYHWSEAQTLQKRRWNNPTTRTAVVQRRVISPSLGPPGRFGGDGGQVEGYEFSIKNSPVSSQRSQQGTAVAGAGGDPGPPLVPWEGLEEWSSNWATSAPRSRENLPKGYPGRLSLRKELTTFSASS